MQLMKILVASELKTHRGKHQKCLQWCWLHSSLIWKNVSFNHCRWKMSSIFQLHKMNIVFTFFRLILKMKTVIIAFCVTFVVANSLAGEYASLQSNTFQHWIFMGYNKHVFDRKEIICVWFISSQESFFFLFWARLTLNWINLNRSLNSLPGKVCFKKWSSKRSIRPFLSSLVPLLQNESKWETILMKISSDAVLFSCKSKSSTEECVRT